MNKYESVIIINPSVDDEKLKALEAKFTELINNDGKLTKIDELGKRKLAYDVKKNKEGIYIVLYFEANRRKVKLVTTEKEYEFYGKISELWEQLLE